MVAREFDGATSHCVRRDGQTDLEVLRQRHRRSDDVIGASACAMIGRFVRCPALPVDSLAVGEGRDYQPV